MTSRVVKIIGSEQKGPQVSCGEYIDTGPDREVYWLKGINCTVEEFIEWFFETPEGENFCSDQEVLIDIGGTGLDMSVGKTLTVTFDEYIAGWRGRTRQWQLNQVQKDAISAFDWLEIEHWYGEPLSLMAPARRMDIAYHLHRTGVLSKEQLGEISSECGKAWADSKHADQTDLLIDDELNELLPKLEVPS